MCCMRIYFQPLNNLNLEQKYLIFRIDELLCRLVECAIHTSVDFVDIAYVQIPAHCNDRYIPQLQSRVRLCSPWTSECSCQTVEIGPHRLGPRLRGPNRWGMNAHIH